MNPVPMKIPSPPPMANQRPRFAWPLVILVFIGIRVQWLKNNEESVKKTTLAQMKD